MDEKERYEARKRILASVITNGYTCGYELPDDFDDDDSWIRCGKPAQQITLFLVENFPDTLTEDYLDLRCWEHRFGG